MDPLHITEFASPRYFDKVNKLDRTAHNASASSTAAAEAAGMSPLVPSTSGSTFVLPLGRQRSLENEGPPLSLRPRDQKKRSLGHDLTSLRFQRRPSFTGSLGSLYSKVSIVHKTPSISEHHEFMLAVDPTAPQTLSLSDLFLSLPTELQSQIISPLPIHTILDLRLVSKAFHAVVSENESTIARYHATYSLPRYAIQLYPLPAPGSINLHYICSVWHRLHVARKLSLRIADQATKEIFLRVTETQLREFAPQLDRMRRRLMPLVFTLFHFFETCRELHVRALSTGVPLNRQAYTIHPIEQQVMAMYDDRTLLKVHQVFPLVMASFSRRLRPPSYAGQLERAIKGYLKDRPADEVYATILNIGGLRQAQRFWETKGYNARRTAVDIWYGYVTRVPVEIAPKSKISKITSHLGRKKTKESANSAASDSLSRKQTKERGNSATSESSTLASHGEAACREWYCVKPQCQAARKRHSTDNLVFHSSLAEGPPMSPLSRETLRQVLQDPQALHEMWVITAEHLILERKIVERTQDIKRSTQVLLELIREDSIDGLDEWDVGYIPEPATNTNRESQDGGISD